jgi:hypothetical protein
MAYSDLDIMACKIRKDFFQCGGGDRRHYGMGKICIMEVDIGQEAQYSFCLLYEWRVDHLYCIGR